VRVSTGSRISFEDILNKCIDGIIRGDLPELCLLDFPHQAQDLKPLLDTALIMKKVSEIQPQPEFKSRAIDKLRFISIQEWK
jgi:hypothetical protein